MTANQIAYQANLETRRANRAKEYENYRSNKAKEDELNRSNLAKEVETNRSNRMNEYLTTLRDFSKAPLYYGTYKVSEGLAGTDIFGKDPESTVTSSTETKIQQADKFANIMNTLDTGVKAGLGINKRIGFNPFVKSIFGSQQPITLTDESEEKLEQSDKRMKVGRKRK